MVPVETLVTSEVPLSRSLLAVVGSTLIPPKTLNGLGFLNLLWSLLNGSLLKGVGWKLKTAAVSSVSANDLTVVIGAGVVVVTGVFVVVVGQVVVLILGFLVMKFSGAKGFGLVTNRI